MLRTIAIFPVYLVVAHLEPAHAQAQSFEAIGCVSPEKLECGCRVRVQNLACTPAGPGYGVHFFTGLELNDRLHIVLGGKAIELSHAKHQGESVKGDSDGRWVDEYVGEMLSVKISYVPGRSTCPKDKGEPCEFSDYDAEVVVRSLGSTPRTYRATARCGC